MNLNGVWLPVITPFYNGKIDFSSYQTLVEYYISKGIAGIIPAATTGESPAISEYELEHIIDKTLEYTNSRIPVFVGSGCNYTEKAITAIKVIEKYKVQGILSVSPYFNRPDQRGIFSHFQKISESTDLPIVIYNIPYRTGRNIENDTVYKMAELKNIIGIKDSCGDIKQTMELLLNPPENFSILTGEDLLYYTALTLGAHGGILASAHLYTSSFIDIFNLLKANNHCAALKEWKKVYPLIPLLFQEPNPSPIKYCLNKTMLIQSAELRLPLMEISEELKRKLDNYLLNNDAGRT
jgi:4-hydroxy-tetrahydrodipicolinate synthase